MDKTIISIFTDTDDAEQAISKLEERDYNPKDISIIMKERDNKGNIAKKTGADIGAGTISGATAGGVIGAIAGMVVGAGIIPGLGALFIGGPLAATLGLTGAAAATVSGAATGAVAGGVLGALNGLGLAGKEAADYEESIKQGGILVAVPARIGEEADVRSILEGCNADKIRTIDNSTDEYHTATL